MGVALCLLFLAHHARNGGRNRGPFRESYTPQRMLLNIVDGLLAMIAVIASSSLISVYLLGRFSDFAPGNS